MLTALCLSLFPGLMAFAAATDLFTMTIPNRVSLALVAGFFALALAIGMSPAVVASHVGAGLLVLGVSFGLFARGWIGGGDAKLAAATALWLGFGGLMDYLLYASIFGGALTLILMRFRLAPLPAMLEGQPWAARLHRFDTGIPYGIALAAAALVVYPDSAFMQALG